MKKTVIGLTVGVAVVGAIVFLSIRFKPKGTVKIQAPAPVMVPAEKRKQSISVEQDKRIFLEYKRDNLTLKRNIKRAELAKLMQNAPFGAKTEEMTVLQNEINSIEQEIIEIGRQLREGKSE